MKEMEKEDLKEIEECSYYKHRYDLSNSIGEIVRKLLSEEVDENKIIQYIKYCCEEKIEKLKGIYKINMQARFFYGEECFNTWDKLFVLTEDGKFYSQYLDHMSPKTVEEHFSFETFEAEDYKWKGYQSIVEIDKKTALRIPLTKQPNWIHTYLKSIENK